MKSLVASVLLAASLAAQAAPVFSDNFDANPLGLNATPSGWSVVEGTVDIIGTGFFDFLPGNGRYIDLDGSSANGGTMQIALMLTAGVNYLAQFDLAGSHRGDVNGVNVMFGSTGAAYTLGSAEGFSARMLSFTPVISGSYLLSFANSGGDNLGALLDRVQVSAVPEPGTLALVLGALGLMAHRARRSAR
jgi:hypothetical protein